MNGSDPMDTFLGKIFAAVLFTVLSAVPVFGQELNCRVSVDYSKLSGTNYDFLNEFGRLAQEYLNENAWTDDRFQEHERIDCEVNVIFEEAITLTRFRARVILTSRRPIYGTSQNTTVLQVNDPEWQFEYTQGTPFVFEPERFDPLTSVLDFYAYVILGYDYDTFSEMGGTEFFRRARRIAELAQARGAEGWSQVGSNRNRTSLVTQILDPRFQPLRRAYYTYHFQGLDRFVIDTESARQSVLDVLGELQRLYENVSRQYALDLFFSAKYDELAAVFEDSPVGPQAYQLLSTLDPSNLSQYTRIIE